MSEAASEEKPRRSSWGGARNRASRTSDSLTLQQAAKLIEAAQCAVVIGLPLNRHVTIHWERLGVSDSQAAKATGRFLKLASDWTAKRGHRLAWLWVRENVGDKGSHVHIAVHVPAGLSFGSMQRRWLRSITGGAYRRTGIRTKRVAGAARMATEAPATYQLNLVKLIDYVLKGASPEAARALGLKPVAQGVIVGKRCATSENIGPTQQERSL